MSADLATPGSAERRRVPGEVGIWLLIAGDLLVFAVLFGTIVHTRADDPAVFTASQGELAVWVGLVNTVLLLTSSLLVARGVRVMSGRAPGDARRMIGGAIACGLAFVVLKAYDYTHLVSDGFVPAANHFFQYFFVFTGIHLFHVLLGLGVLVWMRRATRTARPDLRLVESGASFWHLVDLLWVVLFALFYLLP
jgi:nitric oxide reductase NorE protein